MKAGFKIEYINCGCEYPNVKYIRVYNYHNINEIVLNNSNSKRGKDNGNYIGQWKIKYKNN